MASSLLIIFFAVVLSVSVADDNQLCGVLGCGSVSVETNPRLAELCIKYMCRVLPLVQPTQRQVPLNEMRYPFYEPSFFFENNLPQEPQNVDPATSLADWPGWGQYLEVKDFNAWKQMIARIKNGTNLDNWYKARKVDQMLFNRVSRILNSHIGVKDDLLNFLAFRLVPVPFFHWFKDHLVYHPPQQIFHPMNPTNPNIHFPMLPRMPPNMNQFPFLFPGVGDPNYPKYPVSPQRPSQTICTSNNCASVNVTFDVRVGNITHCSAVANEPRQKLKNLLILASHSHKCLTFTTTQRTPTARSPSGEFLYSVDGITETMQHKWIIYLKSSKKHADLKNYWPSDGDYFIIDYVDANTLQNMNK